MADTLTRGYLRKVGPIQQMYITRPVRFLSTDSGGKVELSPTDHPQKFVWIFKGMHMPFDCTWAWGTDVVCNSGASQCFRSRRGRAVPCKTPASLTRSSPLPHAYLAQGSDVTLMNIEADILQLDLLDAREFASLSERLRSIALDQGTPLSGIKAIVKAVTEHAIKGFNSKGTGWSPLGGQNVTRRDCLGGETVVRSAAKRSKKAFTAEGCCLGCKRSFEEGSATPPPPAYTVW
jgi:hypothetical protein